MDACSPAFCGTSFEDVQWGCMSCYGMIPGGECTGDCKVPADLPTEEIVVDDLTGVSIWLTYSQVFN